MSAETAETTAPPAVAIIPPPKVTLHWLEQSRSQRIVWLLQECKGIDLEIKTYKRGPDMLAPAELKQVHPLGKSPVITVEAPNQKPLVLAESAAICEYLCDYFAKHLVPNRYPAGKEALVGSETESWLRYRYFMHYAEGSLMTLLMIALFMDQIKTSPQPFFVKPITKTITGRVDAAFLTRNYATQFGFLNEQLATSPEGGKFLCGKDLTAADILMTYPLIAGQSKIDFAKYPKLAEYIKMLETHPGYIASTKKIEEVTGEPFKAMLDARR